MALKVVKAWVREFRLETLRPLRIKRAARVRAKARGRFVGVTGSSGKSTTTTLIAAVLREQGTVLHQVLYNTINVLIRTIRRSREADFVVVEAGVGGKGQMAQMAGLLRPDVAVVTLVGLEHYSAFRSREAIAAEKGALVEAISEDGFAVLNADDPLVMGMARRTGARVVTFGHSETADCRILKVGGGSPDGITVRLSWKNQEFDVPTQFIAHHFSQAVAAAATVGLELGVPVEDICKAIGQTEVIPLRLSPHKVPGGPLILADCRKAPQGTLHLAFDALRVVDAPRHRIVLGNISDYAGSSKVTYRRAVADGLDVAEELILITKSRSCTVAAQKADTEGRLRIFGTTREAAEYVARTAIEGEAILLKGSGNLHMERILLNLTSGVKCWENVCRVGETCFACGLYAHEFEDHARIRRRRGWARFWRGPKTTPATQSPSAQ